MNKPKYLYHASSNKNIKVFEPRRESVRDPKEGPVVFATPDKGLATVFIVPSSGSWISSGMFNNIPYFVCSDMGRFNVLDRGGTIYTLPSNSFENDPGKGLGEKEWTSKTTVRPIGRQNYDSALEAMLDAGVQVYFIDKKTHQEIRESPDHGFKIIQSLVSENKKRNKNVKEYN